MRTLHRIHRIRTESSFSSRESRSFNHPLLEGLEIQGGKTSKALLTVKLHLSRADALVGLHQDPSFVFTEDYQTELMMKHFDAFDVLRKKDFFVGEMIWNFADFRTNQG